MGRVRSDEEKRRAAERAKAWYQDPANKERAKEWKRLREEKNPGALREKNREYSRRWREQNPEKRRLAWIKSKYKLTDEQAQRILDSRGLCESCGIDPAKHIDHDHSTGAFRGQLCHGCNSAAGFLRDEPSRAIALADYLTRTGQAPKG